MVIKTLSVGGGATVQALDGPTNFLAWNQDVKGVSTRHKVWKLIDGEEVILEKRERPKKGASVQDREEHQWDREDYEAQQDKIKEALDILNESVCYAIRLSMQNEGLETPNEVYEHLKTQYEPNKYRSRITAYHEMEAITWKSDMTITKLANTLQHVKINIEAADGTYTNDILVAKLARTLPKDYDDFVSRYIDLADTEPKFEMLIADLQTYEARFVTRNQTGTPDGTQDAKKDKKKKKYRPRCKKPPGCGLFGHTNEECRKLHTELGPIPSKGEKEANAVKNNDTGDKP